MANYKLISFDKISSTQNYAHELIANNTASHKTVVLANSQTGGRGRYRRQWVSAKGNLYASFIYNMPRQDPRLSYAIAVAVADTFVHFGIKPIIKWPNDILVSGKKISGILIEYSKDFVVIGIGINIKYNPKIVQYETEKMNSFGDFNRDIVLAELIKNIDFWMKKDFESVRKHWTDFAYLNKTILYRGKSVELIGINSDGALVLRDGTDYVTTYGDEISV